MAECARPRAQQCGKPGPAAIFQSARNICGWLRPGAGALRCGQCQRPNRITEPEKFACVRLTPLENYIYAHADGQKEPVKPPPM